MTNASGKTTGAALTIITFTFAAVVALAAGPALATDEWAAASDDSQFKYAKSLEKSGETFKAAREFERVYIGFPTSPLAPEALYRSAGAYQQAGQNKKADSLYHILIDMYPDSTFASKSRAALEGAEESGFIDAAAPDIFPNDTPAIATLAVDANDARAAAEIFPAKGTADKEEKKDEKKKILTFEYELDGHYSNVAVYASLTDKPIPEAGEMGEFELYRRLIFGSLIPRFMVIEAAVFPLPALGVFLKKNATNFYEDMDFGGGFNAIEAITAGFEEPYALTLFLGNIIRFKKQGEEFEGGNFGYTGYLISIGDKHIKDNELVDDNWIEAEWKLKGDRSFSTHKLSWSFRVGTKLHGNEEIKDVYYVGLRRGRLGFEDSAGSIFDNTGFEYRVDVDKDDFSPIRHYFTVDKRWPWKEKKMGVSFVVGFIWEGEEKYTGSLDTGEDNDEWQIILRPNIHF